MNLGGQDSAKLPLHACFHQRRDHQGAGGHFLSTGEEGSVDNSFQKLGLK